MCVCRPAGSGRWGTWVWHPAWCCTEPETRVCSGWWAPPPSWTSGGQRSRTSRPDGRSLSACCCPLSCTPKKEIIRWRQDDIIHTYVLIYMNSYIVKNAEHAFQNGLLLNIHTLKASSSGLSSLIKHYISRALGAICSNLPGCCIGLLLNTWFPSISS